MGRETGHSLIINDLPYFSPRQEIMYYQRVHLLICRLLFWTPQERFVHAEVQPM